MRGARVRPLAVVVSYRLGGVDGVSVEAAKWGRALEGLGFALRTVAGAGAADVVLPGLGADPTVAPPPSAALARALEGADVVVVENLCSLPLNPGAGAALCEVLAGHAAVFHHHDLPWQRAHLAHLPPPATGGRWLHVTINDRSRRELAASGIPARRIWNRFASPLGRGDRAGTRASLGVGARRPLLVQPTRALPRKGIAAGLALAGALGAVYWLLGPPEDGYDAELERLLAGAEAAGIEWRWPLDAAAGASVADAYAAADAVVLPSSWEGFGNPVLEGVAADRPVAVGDYPVVGELRAAGLRLFRIDDPERLRSELEAPDHALLAHNQSVLRERFSLSTLADELRGLLRAVGVALPTSPGGEVQVGEHRRVVEADQ